MRLPRFTLATIMGIVLVASLDLAAIRLADRYPSPACKIFVLVSMPMASLLAIGLPTLLRSYKTGGTPRPTLLGFEIFGVAALLFAYGFTFACPQPVEWFLNAAVRQLGFRAGPRWYGDFFGLPAIFLMLMLPQVLIALAGGWFLGKFKVTIERRSHPFEVVAG